MLQLACKITQPVSSRHSQTDPHSAQLLKMLRHFSCWFGKKCQNPEILRDLFFYLGYFTSECSKLTCFLQVLTSSQRPVGKCRDTMQATSEHLEVDSSNLKKGAECWNPKESETYFRPILLFYALRASIQSDSTCFIQVFTHISSQARWENVETFCMPLLCDPNWLAKWIDMFV